MSLQKKLHLLHLLLLGPGGDDARAILLAEAAHLGQALGLLLNNRQRLLAEVFNKSAGFFRADALNQAGAEVANDALGARGQALVKARHMELVAVARIIFPDAFHGQHFAGAHSRQGTNDSEQTVARRAGRAAASTGAGAKTCNGVVRFLVMKNDALNRAFKCWHAWRFWVESCD